MRVAHMGVRNSNTSPGRSRNMAAIKAKNTTPELIVRRLLRKLGWSGYRLHRRELPGKPDITFLGRHKVIFVHGCFWHGHECKEGIRRPKTNRDYWLPKIERNQERDAQHIDELKRAGWHVLTIWECDLLDQQKLTEKITTFMGNTP